MKNENDNNESIESEVKNNNNGNNNENDNVEIGDCHYSTNALIDRCRKFGKYHIKMNGKKSTPKKRAACYNCYHYLINNNLATVMFN